MEYSKDDIHINEIKFIDYIYWTGYDTDPGKERIKTKITKTPYSYLEKKRLEDKETKERVYIERKFNFILLEIISEYIAGCSNILYTSEIKNRKETERLNINIRNNIHNTFKQKKNKISNKEDSSLLMALKDIKQKKTLSNKLFPAARTISLAQYLYTGFLEAKDKDRSKIVKKEINNMMKRFKGHTLNDILYLVRLKDATFKAEAEKEFFLGFYNIPAKGTVHGPLSEVEIARMISLITCSLPSGEIKIASSFGYGENFTSISDFWYFCRGFYTYCSMMLDDGVNKFDTVTTKSVCTALIYVLDSWENEIIKNIVGLIASASINIGILTNDMCPGIKIYDQSLKYLIEM